MIRFRLGFSCFFCLLSLWVGMAPAKAEVARTILVLGDSLTAGYGLPQDQAFPVVLQAHLADMGRHVIVRNGGVSGDTTAGGLARLDWALSPKPDGVILELGANDALRGLVPENAYSNLKAIITKLHGKNIPVLLAGMKAPRNYGADYAKAFDAIYPRLSSEMSVQLYPFFMDGVITSLAGTTFATDLLQQDGLHPTHAGVKVIVKHMSPYVVQWLDGLPK